MSEPERCHVYKMGKDEPEHEMSVSCFCHPVLHYADIATKGEVWVHRERKELTQ